MKWIHNDKVSLGWAIFVELVVHLFFAVQAFLLGGFLGEIALEHAVGKVWANWIGSIFLGLIIAGASLQAFVLGEYMKEHVVAFETTAKGDGSYKRSWHQILFIVGGMELSSLFFRCLVVLIQGDWQQAIVVLVLGLIMLWYAFAQAKVIHASVNRPVEYDVDRARQHAGRDIVQQSVKLIPGMTAEQKRRFYTGDLSCVDEAESSNLQRKQEKLQPKAERRKIEKQRQQEQERDFQTAQDYTSKLLGGTPLPPRTPDNAFLRASLMPRQDDQGSNQRGA